MVTPTAPVGMLIRTTAASAVTPGDYRIEQLADPGSFAEEEADLRSSDPLGFFERRVKEHPDDLAARLDLAHRYLDAGMVEDALSEYAVALELDPDDAEALAHVGIILYQNGRPEEALRSVDRALSTDPRYPEGLFIRGVILLRGLDRRISKETDLPVHLVDAPLECVTCHH